MQVTRTNIVMALLGDVAEEVNVTLGDRMENLRRIEDAALRLRKALQNQSVEEMRNPKPVKRAPNADIAEADALRADDLYASAVLVVRGANKVSTSLVQRHLGIGYNRAARLVEAMEACGVVTAMDQKTGHRSVVSK